MIWNLTIYGFLVGQVPSRIVSTTLSKYPCNSVVAHHHKEHLVFRYHWIPSAITKPGVQRHELVCYWYYLENRCVCYHVVDYRNNSRKDQEELTEDDFEYFVELYLPYMDLEPAAYPYIDETLKQLDSEGVLL